MVAVKRLTFFFFFSQTLRLVSTYQVSSLSQHVAELEGQLGRADRDKSSLAKQLEDTLGKLTSLEQDNTKVRLTSVQFFSGQFH